MTLRKPSLSGQRIKLYHIGCNCEMGDALLRGFSQDRQKRLTSLRESLLQALGAIAFATSPGFLAILISAVAAIVCVLDLAQLEMLLPVGTLFLQRCRAVADLNPTCGAIREQASILHVAQIFASSHRSQP